MEFVEYSPEVSVCSSRLAQETLKIEQGVSAYGAMAAFLDANLQQLDDFAEWCSGYVSEVVVRGTYEHQHSNPVERNIHKGTKDIFNDRSSRTIIGVGAQLATEVAIKGAARALGWWANKKDKFDTCEQVYSVLVSYITDAQKNANISRAEKELNKIRNSFPLDKKERDKLQGKYSNGITAGIGGLDVSSVVAKGNEEVRNALAYYLMVINRQLYGADEWDKSKMADYYSLLDLNGHYGKEFMLDNQNRYDNIAADQVAYLKLSRGMVKNMFVDLPNIDLGRIVGRASAMAQYDPYAIRRKKVKVGTAGTAVTIAGIIAKNPELAFNGLSTAVAQFLPDDEALSTAREKMRTWGVSGNQVDAIFKNSKIISQKCLDSDLLA